VNGHHQILVIHAPRPRSRLNAAPVSTSWVRAWGKFPETLTDEEYLWEPVPGCWSIRPTGPGGRGEIEQAWPDPEPAPVTKIASRLSHLAVGVFGLRASHHFGDGSRAA
jgi:hypothetical protein